MIQSSNKRKEFLDISWSSFYDSDEKSPSEYTRVPKVKRPIMRHERIP